MTLVELAYEIRTMAQRERPEPMTPEELDEVADAADDLGKRLVTALAEVTGRDPEDFEFPDET